MKRKFNIPKAVAFVVLAVLTIVIAVGATFSWYPRVTNDDDASVKSLNYSVSGKVNSTSTKEITTYVGQNDNGKLTYTEEFTEGVTVTALSGKVNYFKTVITDPSEVNAGDSVVSLYLKGMTMTSNMNGTIHIGIISPEKTYTIYTTNSENGTITIPTLCVEDNIVVKSGESTEVVWFVQVDSDYSNSGAGTITPGSLYVMYN